MEMDGLLVLCPTLIIFLLALLTFFLRRFFSAPFSSKSKNSTTISFSEIVKNGHRFVEWTAELILASPTNTIVLPTSVITGNPKNVEHVLKANFHNYPKGHNQTSVLADLLGGGIFNTDGDHWRLQRKTASLEFNTKTIRSFILGNVHLEVADRLIPRLARAAANDEVVDLQDLLDRLAFDNVCKVAFDVDPARLAGDDSCDEFFRAFESATAICISRFRQPRLLWRLRRALNLGSERQLKRDVSVIDDFAMRVVRERKARTAEEIRNSSDLLSRFIAEDDDFSDEFLRDIVASFVLAGRDTTSSAMAWLFWLVSTRPAVEQRILAEIGAVRTRHGNRAGTLTLDELREMDYLHAAVSESLRLYPPVVLQPRRAEADDVLPDGTAVRAGMSVTYNTYAMGRMEGIWGADWGEFKPERWLDKEGAFRPVSPFRFVVFHAGPRTCLGKEMAYTQMKAVVASVMERFEMEVMDKGREREVEFSMLLRMKGGLVVRVRKRELQQ
ncbi:cytochrome P450 CYP94D108-like [Musa acuminata AAA Group]|uniref:cytochrome P450 CYP94D108-like n=1 Tax=Musa acuminata AAA Group TaxID=214697 RepID=UPI0031DD3891